MSLPMPYLDVQGLKKTFSLPSGKAVHAVRGISFQLYQNETLAVVGESGCGKSTLGRLLTRLQKPTEGSVFFKGTDLSTLDNRAMQAWRKDIQIIFQDPFGSLNPRMTVFETLAEPLKIHKGLKGTALGPAVDHLLDLVGLGTAYRHRFAHEFSGGQRQRIAIGRALASSPGLLVGDEPVSALDVSVQAQIINLLHRLKEKLGLSLILISHDLSVVEHMADRILVMYLGEVVEEAPTSMLFSRPIHPYTRTLLTAIPLPQRPARGLAVLEGEVPSATDPPEGCAFAARCLFAAGRCYRQPPSLAAAFGRHRVACFQADTLPPFSGCLEDRSSDIYRRRSALYRAYSKHLSI